MDIQEIKRIIEAAILVSDAPVNRERLLKLFADESQDGLDKALLGEAIEALQADCAERGVELVEVASGYRYQAISGVANWLNRLWDERRPRYSRALLETLAIMAYRQPITRSEIESIRGVAVSSGIIKSLLEREWVRVVGHRDVPGRPAVFATTKQFLDYFNLKSLSDLPSLPEIKDFDDINGDLFAGEGDAENSGSPSEGAGESGNMPEPDSSGVDEDASEPDAPNDVLLDDDKNTIDNGVEPADDGPIEISNDLRSNVVDKQGGSIPEGSRNDDRSPPPIDDADWPPSEAVN